MIAHLKFFAIFLLASCGAGSAVHALTLILKPDAKIIGRYVFVKDVVLAQPDLPDALLNISLGVAPDVNQMRPISRVMVEVAIRAQMKVDDIQWSGSNVCGAMRPGRYITGEELTAVITPALGRMTNGQGEFKIEEYSGLQPIILPVGRTQAEVELNPTTLLNSWSTANINFMVDGVTVATKPVRFRWTWVRDAWVAQKIIGPGTLLDAADFAKSKVDGIRSGPNLLTDATLPADQIIAKPLAAGQILTTVHLEARKMVKKGGQVMVHYNASGIRIDMQAIALQDGARGDTIPVMNSASKKRILARVVDENNLDFIQ